MTNRVRLTAGILFTTSLLFGAFQNCSEMKSSFPKSSSSMRLGMNGEKIKEFQPTTMYNGGGTLSVLGENLSDLTEIKIDGATCLEKQFVSPNEIRCRAPALMLGSKAVEVAGALMPVPLSYIDFTKVNSVAGRNGQPDIIDGVARLARMHHIGGMVSDGEVMYFTEYRGDVVRSMDLNTFEVKTIAGTVTYSGSGYVNGIGAAARFNYPSGIAVKDGFLYIADRENCAIRKLDLADNSVSTLIGGPRTGGASCNVVDGAADVAKIGRPDTLMLDGDYLYMSELAETGNGVIRRLDLRDRSVVTIAGGVNLDPDDLELDSYWTYPASALDKNLTLPVAVETPHPVVNDETYEFTINQPGALAIRLHFTEFNMDPYDEVELMNAAGETILTLSGDRGTDFWTPVFNTDTVNLEAYISYGGYYGPAPYGFKIDKIEYVTSAGATLAHSWDGPANLAALGAADAFAKIGGDLYFTDNELGMVRKLNLASGQVTGVIGGRDSGTRAVGKFHETVFSGPYGLANDSRYLYISDMGMGGVGPSKTGERIVRMDLVTRDAEVLVQSDMQAGLASNIDGPLANAAVMQPRLLMYDPKRGLFFDCFDVIRRIK